MKISIVQLTFDNLDQVRRFLPGVARLAARPEVMEWIVLDNGSTDGTLEQLERLSARHRKLRLIKSPENLGCGGGRNVAWRAARGEFLLSLDSDADFVEPGVLPRMLADLERPGVGIVGQHGGWVRRGWSWTEEVPAGYCGTVPIVCGFCQFFRRSVVDRWVQRPEYGPYWLDDSELCLQIQAAEGLAGWVADYGVVHAWSKTGGQDERVRRAAWAAFRRRWQRAGLDVHRPRGPLD